MPDFNGGIVTAGDIPCKGNGMTLGLTDGASNYGLANYNYGNYGGGFGSSDTDYGKTAGNGSSFKMGTVNKSYGITTDPTKSGIIADTSSLALSCNMIIKI